MFYNMERFAEKTYLSGWIENFNLEPTDEPSLLPKVSGLEIEIL